MAEWEGSYGGVPAFDKMNLSDVQPALEKAMEMKLTEIEQIGNSAESPTFENTIEALERSGAVLDRAFVYYSILSSNISTSEFRDIEKEMEPKISEFRSKISQDKKLFERIRAVYENSQKEPLESDQQRVVQ